MGVCVLIYNKYLKTNTLESFADCSLSCRNEGRGRRICLSVEILSVFGIADVGSGTKYSSIKVAPNQLSVQTAMPLQVKVYCDCKFRKEKHAQIHLIMLTKE
jgi:hypothetical protein